MNREKVIERLESLIFDGGHSLNENDVIALITVIKAFKAQKWTPCNEDQPTEKMGRVIYCDENGEVGMGLHSEFSDMWYKGDMYGVGGAKVVAWMSLPAPYEGE